MGDGLREITKHMVAVILGGLMAMLIGALLQGCAIGQTKPMSECKSLCQAEKVELYKDEAIECKCQLKR